MKTKNIKTGIILNTLKDIQFDYTFFTLGYENRSIYIAKMLDLNSNSFKTSTNYYFSFNSNKIHDYEINNQYFNRFKFIEISENKFQLYTKFLIEILSKELKKNINILVDITSMSKLMYSSIIKGITLNKNIDMVNVFFTYCPSKYYNPSENIELIHNEPIPLTNNVSLTDSNIKLILNLGIENEVSMGLIDFMQLNYGDLYIFRNSRKDDLRFYEKVDSSNLNLVQNVTKDQVKEYSFSETHYLFSELDFLINKLSNYRIVIAPLGNKIFTLSSVLLALKYKNVTVFRISEGNAGSKQNKYPNESIAPVVINVQFVNKT